MGEIGWLGGWSLSADSDLLLGEGRERWLVLRRGKEGLCGEDEDDQEGSGQGRRKNQKPAGGGGCSFVLPSGDRCRLGKDRFRFRVRVSCFSQCVKLPPSSFCVLWRPVFIGKNIAWASKLIPQLSFFFVNLIFLVFFGFCYQHRLE